MEVVVITLVRLAGSLPVLRWAFVGGLIAVFTDLSDLFLRNLLDLGGLPHYQAWDKWVDQVYLVAFLAVAWRWQGLARRVALALFAYRLAGFLAFAITDNRWVLLGFPNVFEFWFLFIASLPHWRPRFTVDGPAALRWGLALTALKLTQEGVLHAGRWLDDFTAVEAVEAVWDWLTPPF